MADGWSRGRGQAGRSASIHTTLDRIRPRTSAPNNGHLGTAALSAAVKSDLSALGGRRCDALQGCLCVKGARLPRSASETETGVL